MSVSCFDPSLTCTVSRSTAEISGTNRSPTVASSVADTTVHLGAHTLWQTAFVRVSPADLCSLALSAGQPPLAILHLFVQETTLARGATMALPQPRPRPGPGTGAHQHAADDADQVRRGRGLGRAAAAGGQVAAARGGGGYGEHGARDGERGDAGARCGVFETLYTGAEPQTAQGMQEALVVLYVLVLRYLCYVKSHLERSTAGEALVASVVSVC